MPRDYKIALGEGFSRVEIRVPRQPGSSRSRRVDLHGVTIEVPRIQETRGMRIRKGSQFARLNPGIEYLVKRLDEDTDLQSHTASFWYAGGATPRPDWGVDDYCAAVRELDRSEAGKRARDLLFAYLSEEQLEQLTWTAGQAFWSIKFHPEAEWFAEHGLDIPMWRAAFWRDSPAGNVRLSYSLAQATKDLDIIACIHPMRPYPTDDIILGQLLMYEHDAEEFIKTANLTFAGSRHQLPMTKLWEPVERYKQRLARKRGALYVPEAAEMLRVHGDRSWRRSKRSEEVLAYIDRVLAET